MTELDGLWLDTDPVQQFLYYDDTWSNFFFFKDCCYLVEGTGITPSGSSFKQISGGALAKW